MEEVRKRMFVIVKATFDKMTEYVNFKPVAASSDLKKVQDYVDEMCLKEGDNRAYHYHEVKELE